jgi:hypothetical protein
MVLASDLTRITYMMVHTLSGPWVWSGVHIFQGGGWAVLGAHAD